ncbi:hypothetical protein L6164_005876 [Bauhinia variegata]|uniref:Uncharacterized protein n=1 Tax=Bauhinia variegata TaxID=167791 RepID=A0ACB9PT47_BAUVA|nr:hypothetical protein L6164_005876 [Bauhinia variegata]
MSIKSKVLLPNLYLICLVFFVVGFPDSVRDDCSPPSPKNRTRMTLLPLLVGCTISSDLGGAPFGNVVSFSDGLPNKGSGIPYFYLTTLDPTARYALKDQRSSFTVSEYPLGTCGKTDPENPTCAKITLSGKLKLVDAKSKEAELARNALFAKHTEMKDWPANHNFQVFKLEIESIFLIDWFGGPKPLTVEQYLHPKMNNLAFFL